MEFQGEIKEIEGYEGKYAVTTKGKVISLNYNRTGKPKELKIKINHLGFPTVKLCKNNKTKEFMVGRLVLQTFKPTKKKKVVAINVDGDKLNCDLDNLKWVLHSEQRHLMYKRGNRKGCASENKVGYRRKGHRRKGYKNYSELARDFNLTPKQLLQRLENGWTLDESLNIKCDIKNKGGKPYFYDYYGKLMSIYQISKITKIPAKLISQRLLRNWNIYEAAEVPIATKKKGEENE